MKNCKLLFEMNNTEKFDYKIKKKLKFKNKQMVYTVNVNGTFNGDHIFEIISVVNYVRKVYRQKIPIVIFLGKFEFYDKLVYIILESIVYYLNEIDGHKIDIRFEAKHTIWTEGIRYSSLINQSMLYNRYKYDLNMYHFRKLIPERNGRKDEYLSNLLQDIYGFLYNNGIEDITCEKLSEVIIELVGNAGEHGNSECLLDIDITQSEYGKRDEKGIFYGLNVVILNCSPTLFYEPLKEKLSSDIKLSKRYNDVLKAKEYHFAHFNDNYKEDDFYTISSFQHKISGSRLKDQLGGTGLTSLLRSLEEDSDTHLCYMLSGRRILFFEKEHMIYDNNEYVGFNKNKDYFSDIPDINLFNTINTFWPGVAYNLNYAVKKENSYE